MLGIEKSQALDFLTWDFAVGVEAMGLEPTNLLTASQALYQLSYAPVGKPPRLGMVLRLPHPGPHLLGKPRTTQQHRGHPVRSGVRP